MTCPFCGTKAEGAAMHEHLADAHGDRLVFEEIGDRTLFGITCPICGDSYRRPVKKSAGDPGFLDEFDRQIRLVAFDMLIHHVMATHELVDD